MTENNITNHDLQNALAAQSKELRAAIKDAIAENNNVIYKAVADIVADATQEILTVVDRRFTVVEQDIKELKHRVNGIGHKFDAISATVTTHDHLIGYNLQINRLKQLPT